MSHPYITKSNGELRYKQMLETAENHRRFKKLNSRNGRRLIPTVTSFLGRIYLYPVARESRKATTNEALPAS